MNGYELTAKFRRVRKKYSFSNIEADLFYELVAICNDEEWPNTFQYPNALICATIGVSEKSLIAARNRLQQANLLEFVSGHKRHPTTYSFKIGLLKVSKNDSINGSVNGSINGSITGKNASDSLLKEKEKEKLKEVIKMPFDSLGFTNAWQKWKTYKKEQFGFTYKSITSENQALKQLAELAKENESNAVQIINYSIGQSYKGLFAPKQFNAPSPQFKSNIPYV